MHTHTHTHTHTRICWNTYTCANHIHTHMLEHIHASARISASRCMSFNTTDKRTTKLWRYQNEAKRFGTSERQNSGDTRMKQNASGQANPTKLCASLSIRKLAQLQRACALYDFNQKPLLSDLHNVGTALLGREMFGPNHLYTLGKLFVFVL